MLRIRTLPAVALAAFFLSFSLLAASAPAQSGPGTPVAHVNGKPIPKVEYDRTLSAFSKMRGAQGASSAPSDEVKDEAIKQLVNRELLYQESLKKPLKDLQQKAEEEFKKLKAGAPSPQEFQEKLKANSMSEKELKETISKQLSIQGYVEKEIISAIKVTEADAQKFYNQNKDKFKVPDRMKASHILLKVAPNATAADKEKALAKARALRKRAAKGEDFAKLAKENSQDTGSAAKGGDLGYFARQQMVPPFSEAAFALKAGQVSDVVETQFGYHVIKAGDRKPASQQSFAEVKDKLTEFLKAKALDEALTKKVDELRRAATITIVGSAQK